MIATKAMRPTTATMPRTMYAIVGVSCAGRLVWAATRGMGTCSRRISYWNSCGKIGNCERPLSDIASTNLHFINEAYKSVRVHGLGACEGMKYLPILLLLVCVAAIAPLLNAQQLQLCHDNGTYADDAVITACLDKTSYNAGDNVQVFGFLRANKLVVDTLPPDVNVQWWLDKPNNLNNAVGVVSTSAPNYTFTFTLQPDLAGDWLVTLLTPELGHNALHFTVHVESPLTTITTQSVVVSTSQVTATVLSNTLVSHTKTVVTVVPEFSGLAVVAFIALTASLILLRRTKNYGKATRASRRM